MTVSDLTPEPESESEIEHRRSLNDRELARELQRDWIQALIHARNEAEHLHALIGMRKFCRRMRRWMLAMLGVALVFVPWWVYPGLVFTIFAIGYGARSDTRAIEGMAAELADIKKLPTGGPYR